MRVVTVQLGILWWYKKILAMYTQAADDNPVSICCNVNQFNLNRTL